MAKLKHARRGLIRLFELISNTSKAATDADGQTVTEYAVVLSVVIIAFAGVVFALQDEIASFIDKVGVEIAGIVS